MPTPRGHFFVWRSRMKLIATCMASNESDVIEAFVRHNLSVLDAVVVLDHGSVDRTPEILRSLAGEGLPLVVLEDRDRAFRQGERQTYLARRYLGELQADFCFLLDADEFVRMDSRAALESGLAALPPDAHGLVRLQNYVGVGADGGALNPVARITRRMAGERRPVRKAVVRAGFARGAKGHVSLGNHAAVRVVSGHA